MAIVRLHSSSTLCSADEVSGAEFLASFVGYCFKIELIDHVGKLIGDQTADPTCATKSGTGTPAVSNFNGFDKNTAVWSSIGAVGFSGTMYFKRDSTISGPAFINNDGRMGKYLMSLLSYQVVSKLLKSVICC